MFGRLPRAWKQKLKGRWKQTRRSWIARWYAFSAQDLENASRSLGLSAGDTLMVHSSFDRFEGFTGKPTDVIEALKRILGPEGTLLMPTMPFSGSALDYAARNEVLDVSRSPSRMGIVTELFRRSPGVRRSAHPTHPVAGWGAGAEQMLADHFLAQTPCGRQTPFGRLLDAGGKILFLGVRITTMTFFHAVEELLEPQMPFSPFTNEVFTLSCRDADGSVRQTATRLFDRAVSRNRKIARMIPELKRAGCWHETRVGRLPIILLCAADVWNACQALADRGIFCYER
jgi:aminoglycoside 3-N-acetyltransferase